MNCPYVNTDTMSKHGEMTSCNEGSGIRYMCSTCGFSTFRFIGEPISDKAQLEALEM